MADSKFFGIPFATSGDRATIPEATQPSGDVSYQQGFGPDFERDPETDPLYKPVPRDETNELYYQLTNSMKFLQLYGTPEWYAEDDAGNPVSYPVSARVRYDAGAGMQLWQSIAASNTAVPGSDATKWQRVELFKSADYLPLAGGVTMTGLYELFADPTTDMQPTTKRYVDRPTNVFITAATTLTQAQLRRYVQVGGADTYAITLPNPTASTGGQFLIYNASSSEKTLITPSGNFVGPSGTGSTTTVLPRGAFMWLIAGFDNWIVVYQTYSYKLLTGAASLNAGDLNGYVQLSGGSTFQVNVPDPSLYSGASLEIYNAGGISYTLRTVPGSSFVGPKGSSAQTMTIPAGEYLMLRAGSVNWIVH